MKKIIFFAFAAAALVGCVKENLNSIEEGTVRTMTISAGVDADTKAHLDVKTVMWDATDVLGLYDGGSAIKKFTTSEDKLNGASADFTGEAAYLQMYYAVYPYSDAVSFDASTNTFTTSIPTTQTASVDNGFMNGAYIAVAKADCASGEPLRFKNVCSYIKVTVSEANVKKVVVKSASGSKLLTGKINVKVTDGDPETTVYDGSTLVYLVPASGSDYIDPGTYYIAVAPQNLNASEYSIRKVYDSTMKVWTGTKAFELKRNTPVNFGDLAAANFTWEEFTQVDLNTAWNTLEGHTGAAGTHDQLYDGNLLTYYQASGFRENGSGITAAGPLMRWNLRRDVGGKVYGVKAYVFEYRTITYWGESGGNYEGYPTPGYLRVPWTLTLSTLYSATEGASTGQTRHYAFKTLTVEDDALPWEGNGAIYTSDVITYNQPKAAVQDEIRDFMIGCTRTRHISAGGVLAKDATEGITWRTTDNYYGFAFAEMKLWVKE